MSRQEPVSSSASSSKRASSAGAPPRSARCRLSRSSGACAGRGQGGLGPGRVGARAGRGQGGSGPSAGCPGPAAPARRGAALAIARPRTSSQVLGYRVRLCKIGYPVGYIVGTIGQVQVVQVQRRLRGARAARASAHPRTSSRRAARPALHARRGSQVAGSAGRVAWRRSQACMRTCAALRWNT
jgi:hypothetical protein